MKIVKESKSKQRERVNRERIGQRKKERKKERKKDKKNRK